MMNNGLEQMGIDLNETLGALKPQKKIERTVTVKSSRIIDPRGIFKISE